MFYFNFYHKCTFVRYKSIRIQLELQALGGGVDGRVRCGDLRQHGGHITPTQAQEIYKPTANFFPWGKGIFYNY